MIRRRVAKGLLVFVALWPVVTLVLQARWAVDPWKLMSFGMYAVPARRVEDAQLTLAVKRGVQWEPLEQGRVADEADRYLHARRSLGRLASTTALLDAMLKATGATHARIEVAQARLDADTARVVFDRDVLELK